MVSDSDSRDVVVVTDEIWPQSAADDLNWMYMGSLFIDERFLDDVCNAFLNARYDCGDWVAAQSAAAWQEQDTPAQAPVGFPQCDGGEAYAVAERWLTLIRQRFDVTEQCRLKITGVDLDDIDDGADDRAGVYDAVLREHLIDARSHFFGSDIHVNYQQLYHTATDQQHRNAFTRQLYRINDPLTSFGDVRFHDTAHNTYRQGSIDWRMAHLLQLTNVVLGAAAHLFTDRHLIHKKAKLSWMLRDLVQNSMDYEEPTVDRCTLAFFPRDTTKHADDFYYWRDIQRPDPHKESLDRFM